MNKREQGDGGVMPLEQQVCSLELSKKLKELGVRQTAIFNWWNIPKTLSPKGLFVTGPICEEERWVPMYRDDFSADMKAHGKKIEDYRFSAFTVAELGEMLPTTTSKSNSTFWENPEERWLCGPIMQLKDDDRKPFPQLEQFMCAGFFGRTEADARAKMLIHLIEKGIVKP